MALRELPGIITPYLDLKIEILKLCHTIVGLPAPQIGAIQQHSLSRIFDWVEVNQAS